jgi:hypothetical protein
MTEALHFIANGPRLRQLGAHRARDQGRAGRPGWPLFEAWSGRAAKNVPETTEQGLAWPEAGRIGAGTLYKLALEAGWEPAPSLQLNGALATNGTHPAKEFLDMLDSSRPIIGSGTSPHERLR